jgi:AbrB family looped-hinge helix DNA binding protein
VLLLYVSLQCKAMTEATLSTKNQIIIPREAREALRLKPGDKVIFLVRSGGILLLRKPQSYHAAIRVLARGAYPKTYHQRERKSWIRAGPHFLQHHCGIALDSTIVTSLETNRRYLACTHHAFS